MTATASNPTIYPQGHTHDTAYNPLDYPRAEKVLRGLGIPQAYEGLKAKFGGGPVGEISYARTYSRKMSNGRQERWGDTVLRCMSGWLAAIIHHAEVSGIDPCAIVEDMEADIREMYDGFFHMRWMPSGRGLWAAGTKMMQRSGTGLMNCAFKSTRFSGASQEALVQALGHIMDNLMCGCGVGTDLRGERANVWRPNKDRAMWDVVVVEDSREGWVEAMMRVWASYLLPDRGAVELDTSKIRPEGVPLETTGGVSSGPQPLHDLWRDTVKVLEAQANSRMSGPGRLGIEALTDLINLIGRAVAMGNIRRSAEIIIYPALGRDAVDFVRLKETEPDPFRPGKRRLRRSDWGWASNNTLEFDECGGVNLSTVSDDTDLEEALIKGILDNGETGFFFRHNINRYSWVGTHDERDVATVGGNPCGEILLEDGEFCNIPKVILPNCGGFVERISAAVRSAYLWGKVMTTLRHHIPLSDDVVRRNRRLGVCASGVVDHLDIVGFEFDYSQFTRPMVDYDRKFSDRLGIAPSIRLFAVAPDGTTGKLPGISSGVHAHWARYMVQRMRVAETSPLWRQAEAAGYPVEDLLVGGRPVSHTKVITFPVFNRSAKTSARERSMFQQIAVAAKMSREWADNAVSITITIPPHEANGRDLTRAVQLASLQLKTASFLPFEDPKSSGYDQLPWEEITHEEWQAMTSKLTPVSDWLAEHDQSDTGCAGEACEIKAR